MGWALFSDKMQDAGKGNHEICLGKGVGNEQPIYAFVHVVQLY